ncbi:MAG: iron-sulfur cluster assembly scaffold protein [Desulfobulbaceae bacterium]|nr:MAG: iron-sulfur cluster assembly scaffold protein [Desulfobulbaceae bacterium]
MSLSGFLVLFGVLLGFVMVWYLLSYWLTPQMDNPDGFARITGNCGDTMEIGLKIDNGKVSTTHHWTDGCSVSGQCVDTAARLAVNKSVAEVNRLNMMDIMAEVGRLPDSHLHCAQLAETTLHHAVKDYIKRQSQS